MPTLATVIAFCVTLFNMIKIRLWPRILPLIQPQRLFTAFMIYGTSKTATNKNNGKKPILKKSIKTSIPIGSASLKRSFSTKTPSAKNNVNTNDNINNGNNNTSNNVIFQDKFMDDVFWNLSTQGPAFSVNPSNIDFIQEPNDFYNHLIDGIKRATKRITFASLYLGTGKQEIQMVKELEEACMRNPELKVHILLDGLRGTRLGLVDGVKQSSATLLLNLYKQYPNQVEISLYHTPDLNGILKKVLPPRVNETIGVNHIKTYLFDDDLLLSGANLSKDYFTNRQDRYVWIRATKSVSNYFNKIVEIIGSFSLKLSEDGQAVLPPKSVDPVTASNEFKSYAYRKLANLLKANQFYDNNGQCHSSPHDITQDVNDCTWIFPTIQMGPFDIRQDEVVTSFIFSQIPKDSKFFITSPYFNLTPNYLDLILSGKPQLDIITCSPEANGFHGAKGISSAIPDCYSLIEKSFLQKVQDSGNNQRIKVQEYIRKDWTYHGKGLWITAQKGQIPAITLIGSPNFGSRSVEKDLEAQIVLLTQNKSLQTKMDNERKYLWSDTRDANLDSFNQPERKVSLFVKIIVYLFGNYL